MIAMALANHPALLIGDEPTTALDVSVQAQILELLQKLRDEFGIAVILVTHNLGVVAQIADRVMVMYAGRAVESGGLTDIFRLVGAPLHLGPALLGAERDRPGAAGRHGAAALDRRHAPEPGGHAVRLPVPSPLQLRDGHLPDRGSRGRAGQRPIAHGGLPPAGRSRRPMARLEATSTTTATASGHD